MNLKLTKSYTIEEVILVLKDMVPTKASSNDGFPTLFFQCCWDIIGKDVDFWLKVLNNDMNFNEINFTNIVLIPKIPHLTNLSNFYPISL